MFCNPSFFLEVTYIIADFFDLATPNFKKKRFFFNIYAFSITIIKKIKKFSDFDLLFQKTELY